LAGVRRERQRPETELLKNLSHAVGVLDGRFNQEIDISSEARVAVETDGMAANEQILNFL
jgi:hypothetical protein